MKRPGLIELLEFKRARIDIPFEGKEITLTFDSSAAAEYVHGLLLDGLRWRDTIAAKAEAQS